MSLLSNTYRQNKQIASLIKKIAKELRVERAIVQHFVCTDLERIYSEKLYIHIAKLNILDTQFDELIRRQNQLEQSVKEKEKQLERTNTSVHTVESLLKEKEKILIEKKMILSELQNKLNEINSNIGGVEKTKKTIEYKLLMKKHTVEKQTSTRFKLIGWILTVFTIIAIIIAIILIKHK